MIDKAKGSRADSIVHIRRGSELAPGAHDMPKMKLEDFNLLVVLGKGSFGKVSNLWMKKIYRMFVFYKIVPYLFKHAYL